jgi:hypothetical protein
MKSTKIGPPQTMMIQQYCVNTITIIDFFRGLFGLWFDEGLYHGQTHRCDTYDNDLLTSSEDFIVKVLEAWVFTQD